MKIYTKTGDKGKTSLFDGTRVLKNNIRIETYGTIDELNSTLGVVVSFAERQKEIQELLTLIQKDLLDISSHLANPSGNIEEAFVVYLDERIGQFERVIDDMTGKLPPLSNFILPGGGTIGATLHLARTVARRTERMIIGLSQQETVDQSFIRYFNRLSDLLFTMSRFANNKEGYKDIIWTQFEK